MLVLYITSVLHAIHSTRMVFILNLDLPTTSLYPPRRMFTLSRVISRQLGRQNQPLRCLLWSRHCRTSRSELNPLRCLTRLEKRTKRLTFFFCIPVSKPLKPVNTIRPYVCYVPFPNNFRCQRLSPLATESTDYLPLVFSRSVALKMR